MKLKWIEVLGLVLVILSFSGSAMATGKPYGAYKAPKSYSSHGAYSSGSSTVRGYNKRDGTYVAPHYRTNPNATQRDNWSSRPNVNPYTGKSGTIEPTR